MTTLLTIEYHYYILLHCRFVTSQIRAVSHSARASLTYTGGGRTPILVGNKMVSYSLELEKREYFECNKKANPSVNKLLKVYHMTLTPSGVDATPIADRIVWANKGAGRDWYPAESHPIGLKMYRDGKQYFSNETEWQLYQENAVVRSNSPKLYGHFKISVEEHDFQTEVLLSVLVQSKVGESLMRILARLCTADSWNHYGTKVEVLSMWEKTLVLTDNLASSGVGWCNDFHLFNVNISLCGGRMLLCEWESAGGDKRHIDDMRIALKLLQRYLDLPGRWLSFHVELLRHLNMFLSCASTADICKGWWKDCLREALGAGDVPVHISTPESAAAASGTYTTVACWQPAPWTLKSTDASGTDTAAASPAQTPLPRPAPWKQKSADTSLPGVTATAASGTDTAAASPGGSPLLRPALWKLKSADTSLPGVTATAASGTDTAVASCGTDTVLPGGCKTDGDWTLLN